MADRYELAFLRQALTASGVEEETALVNLLFQRLLAGGFTISSAGVVAFSFNGLFGDGLVGAPSISFTNETTSGRYRIGANNIGESINSTKVLDWNASRLLLTGLHLLWGTDNAQDLGASGANRPRDFFLGRNALIGGTLGVTGVTTLTGGLNTPLTVPNGGSGVATLAAHGVVIGNAAGAVAVTGTGTAAQVLTSNGAAADPTFQDISGFDVLQIEALS